MNKLAKTCFLAVVIGCATFCAMAESTVAEKSELDAKSAKVVERMKAMRLPEIAFEPPKTIADAVSFLRRASKKYDSHKNPKERRGFKIYMRVKDGKAPEIPEFKAEDITFYEALTHVCQAVEYEFSISDGIVSIKPKEARP